VTYQSQNSQNEDNEDNIMPCGIDEKKADRKHLDNLGKEMLDAYLEDNNNDNSPDDSEDEDSNINNNASKNKKSNEHNKENQKKDSIQLTDQDREDDNADEIVKEEKNSNNSSFNGDMKQFHLYLIDRLTETKLNKVKNLIKLYNDSEGTDEQDKEFKSKLESLLNDKERATYLPMIHALINMEDFILNKNK